MVATSGERVKFLCSFPLTVPTQFSAAVFLCASIVLYIMFVLFLFVPCLLCLVCPEGSTVQSPGYFHLHF